MFRGDPPGPTHVIVPQQAQVGCFIECRWPTPENSILVGSTRKLLYAISVQNHCTICQCKLPAQVKVISAELAVTSVTIAKPLIYIAPAYNSVTVKGGGLYGKINQI
nr:MAG TPA: hypothetical protein [Caudoviricetes sp.]